MINSQTTILELHNFADATSHAYGAVVYVRVITGSKVVVHFFAQSHT